MPSNYGEDGSPPSLPTLLPGIAQTTMPATAGTTGTVGPPGARTTSTNPSSAPGELPVSKDTPGLQKPGPSKPKRNSSKSSTGSHEPSGNLRQHAPPPHAPALDLRPRPRGGRDPMERHTDESISRTGSNGRPLQRNVPNRYTTSPGGGVRVRISQMAEATRSASPPQGLTTYGTPSIQTEDEVLPRSIT